MQPGLVCNFWAANGNKQRNAFSENIILLLIGTIDFIKLLLHVLSSVVATQFTSENGAHAYKA